MMMPSGPWVKPAIIGVVILLATGAVSSWFSGRETERIRREEWQSKFESSTRQVEQYKQLLETATRQASQMAQIASSQERRSANVNTVTQREIIRVPAEKVTPIVISGQSAGQGNPQYSQPLAGPGPPPIIQGLTGGDVVEIIRETIRSEDKSTTDSQASTKTDTSTKTEMTSKTETDGIVKTETDVKLESKGSVTETVKTGGGGGKDGIGVGVGVSSSGSPLLVVDVIRGNLGPKVLGLGKLNAGLMAEFGKGKTLKDFGPQINVERKRVFGMVGYGVRESEVRFGIGLKF